MPDLPLTKRVKHWVAEDTGDTCTNCGETITYWHCWKDTCMSFRFWAIKEFIKLEGKEAYSKLWEESRKKDLNDG